MARVVVLPRARKRKAKPPKMCGLHSFFLEWKHDNFVGDSLGPLLRSTEAGVEGADPVFPYNIYSLHRWAV